MFEIYVPLTFGDDSGTTAPHAAVLSEKTLITVLPRIGGLPLISVVLCLTLDSESRSNEVPIRRVAQLTTYVKLKRMKCRLHSNLDVSSSGLIYPFLEHGTRSCISNMN